jgi:hypothetical protein
MKKMSNNKTRYGYKLDKNGIAITRIEKNWLGITFRVKCSDPNKGGFGIVQH